MLGESGGVHGLIFIANYDILLATQQAWVIKIYIGNTAERWPRLRISLRSSYGGEASLKTSNIGRVAEWFKATVLKTVVPQGTVSSNLTPSASPMLLRSYGL